MCLVANFHCWRALTMLPVMHGRTALPTLAGTPQCGGGCPDYSSDPNNCGSCGVVCPAFSHCESGTCRCNAGELAAQRTSELRAGLELPQGTKQCANLCSSCRATVAKQSHLDFLCPATDMPSAGKEPCVGRCDINFATDNNNCADTDHRLAPLAPACNACPLAHAPSSCLGCRWRVWLGVLPHTKVLPRLMHAAQPHC